MARLLLITYDLHDPAYEDDVLGYIKGHKEWDELCGSSYIIVTDKDPSSVRDELKEAAEDEITCFVCPAKAPWASRGLSKSAKSLLRKYA